MGMIILIVIGVVAVIVIVYFVNKGKTGSWNPKSEYSSNLKCTCEPQPSHWQTNHPPILTHTHAGSPPHHFTLERASEKSHLTDINRISYISATGVMGYADANNNDTSKFL